MKFIYWFAYFNLGSPSVRYRAQYPLAYFKREHGIEHVLIVPGYSPGKLLHFLRAYFSALFFRKKGSLIVIQRVSSGFIYAAALKLLVKVRRKSTIYDLDDADYLEHEPRTIHFFAANCERVSAGSRAIMEHLGRFNRNISFVTSPVIDLGIVKKERAPVFTIGWIGDFGGGHKQGLVQLVFPALKRLTPLTKVILIGVRQQEDVRWIREYFAASPQIELEFPYPPSWEDEHWIQQRIAGFDVGVATLVDTPIQRAKSGIKAKQYLNNGVPVLSTDQPENDHVVVDGVNGYFFSSAQEFLERISMLRSMSHADYTTLSTNARASVKAFDHAHYYRDFLELSRPISTNQPARPAQYEV